MKSLLKFTIDLAHKAGKVVIKEKNKSLKVSEKGKNDLVTSADLASEELIVKTIKKTFPDHEILAEESFETTLKAQKAIANSKYIWIIDPIDGTTNFSRGLPEYCISIALMETTKVEKSKNFQYLAGEIILGVIHAPELYETFYATKSGGAWLQKTANSSLSALARPTQLTVSKIKTLKESLTVTGFPPTHKDINLPYFTHMLNHSSAVRRLGSAALDLAYTAAGRFDVFWEFGLHPWDIAAGSLIVKEAGGTVTDTNNELLDLFGKDLLATNGRLHQETVKAFRKL